MTAPVIECGDPTVITATGDVVATRDCYLLGFFVSSTTTGTLVLRKGGSGGTVMSGTITPAAGAFYRFPAFCAGGLHATVANTISVTFFTVPVG